MPAAGKDVPVAAYVGLGSNMGDSRSLLEQARKGLGSLPGLSVGSCSSVYRTEPQGLAAQPFFLNQVVRLDCAQEVGPLFLLERLLELEDRLGRRRDNAVRFGPRSMDLDLLLFGDQRMDTERLTLPHPRMLERAFVLVPLSEIAPDMLLSQGGTVREALEGIHVIRIRDTLYQSSETSAFMPQ